MSNICGMLSLWQCLSQRNSPKTEFTHLHILAFRVKLMPFSKKVQKLTPPYIFTPSLLFCICRPVLRQILNNRTCLINSLCLQKKGARIPHVNKAFMSVRARQNIDICFCHERSQLFYRAKKSEPADSNFCVHWPLWPLAQEENINNHRKTGFSRGSVEKSCQQLVGNYYLTFSLFFVLGLVTQNVI